MRVLLLIVMLQSSMGVFGQAISFNLKGEMTDWKVKKQLSLFYKNGDKEVSDTVDVINGSFEFSGKIDGAAEAKLVCISENKGGVRDLRSFYLDAGKTTFKGTDSLKYVRITGQGATASYEELHAKTAPLMQRFLEVRMKGIAMGKSQRDTPEFQRLVKENSELINAIYEARKAFIFKHPSSIVALHTVKGMAQNAFDVGKIEPLYVALSPSLKKTVSGLQLGKLIELAKTTRIGAILPDFSSLDTLRKPLTLKEVVKKGKVTLVDFWASWCKPCRAENPNVVKAFHAFHAKGFNILSVSLDQNAASWKNAIEKDGMPWYHVSALKYWDEPVVKQFGITGVPDSFLLDGEGKIIARGLRGEALYKKIQEIL